MNALTPIQSRMRTAADIHRRLGTRRFAKEVIPWLFHRRFFFYAQPLEGEFFRPSPKLRFRLVRADEKMLRPLPDIRPGFYHHSLLRKRLSEGHICFLGWNREELIHIRWAFVRSCSPSYLRRTILLPEDETFIDEAFTPPGYRRRGVYTYAGYLMRLMLQEMGYKRLTCAFASWNEAPQRMSERLGMHRVGEGGYFLFPGGRKYFWRGTVRETRDGCVVIEKE